MYEFLSYRVSDVMTKQPVTIAESTTLDQASLIFEGHDFNGLPVIDLDLRLKGVFTKLDLLKAFAFTETSVVPHYEEIMQQPVARFMTAEPVTVQPDAPLTRTLHLMIQHGSKSFPVVDDGRLVGIIAREDVMRGLRQAVSRGEPHP